MSEVTAVRAPVENVNDETIAIMQWLVADGTFVEEGTPLVLAETTKTSFDIPAPAAGFVWRVVAEGVDAPVGSVVCYIGADLERVKTVACAPGATIPQPRPDSHAVAAVPLGIEPALSTSGDVTTACAPVETPPTRFSARATVLLRERGLDAGAFAGRWLVRERDVDAFEHSNRTESRGSAGSLVQSPQTDSTSTADISAAQPSGTAHERTKITPALGVAIRTEALSRTKRFEARHLDASAAHTLQSAVTVAVPTGGFFSSSHAGSQVGLSTATVIYEVSRLLRVHPVFNAFHIDGEIHYYEQVNVGFAIDAGHGLKVPVIHNADRRSLTDIADQTQRHLVDYLSESLPLDALVGGTFTITDLANEGVVHFHPIINDGQAAILGICAVSSLAPGQPGIFNLVLAFDHHLTEGRTAAAFLRDLRDRLTAHEASVRVDRRTTAGEACCESCRRSVEELAGLRQFLVRTVDPAHGEQVICTICLQDW